jgi:5-formyltetrahydrofolate cyclo-ligase
VWDIREPVPALCAAVEVGSLDFALVPGLGFDSRGGRLGYGGGFYDRLLGRLPAASPRVAATFSAQLLDAVPMAPYDQYVDLIVTEHGSLPARR